MLDKLSEFLKNCKDNPAWRRGIATVAVVVVFVTTYMMILPALTKESEVICGKEEHTHTESCYKTKKVLTCGKEESEGHTHTDACYSTEKKLTCGKEESEGHTHTASCYDEDGNLICGKKESEGHTHTADCYETEKVLTCDKKESKGHTHTDACYSTEKELICDKEEHTHTEACFKKSSDNASDSTADVETASDWEKSLSGITLSGNWADDAIAIAKSQLGYTESSDNFTVDDNNKKKGYTRYGAWYGEPYGDWCAMFASFCYFYAGVPTDTMPIDSSCQTWIENLNTKDYPYYYAVNDNNKYDLINGTDSVCWNDPDAELKAWKKQQEADNTDSTEADATKDLDKCTIADACKKYHPQAGDLIFFNWDDEADADHVGIIYSLEYDSNGIIKKINTIEGNSSDSVKYKEHDVDDPEIMGFAKLPENPDYKAKDTDKNSVKSTEAATTENKTTEATTETTEVSTATSEATTETTESTATTTETTEATTETTESTESTETTETEDALTTKTVEGDDYTVTVTYGADAEIPADAELKATEYAENSDTYKQRYEEASKHYNWGTDAEYPDEFRLFNIGFYSANEEIEPAGKVDVNITFKNMEADDDANYQVTHYTDDKVVEMDTSASNEDGEINIDFTTDSFSDVSVSSTSTPASDNSDNLLANFSFDDDSLVDDTENAKAVVYGGSDDVFGHTNTLNSGATFRTIGYSRGPVETYKRYLNITDMSGNALLDGYDALSFDFYMRAYDKTASTSLTDDTDEGWPIYVGADGNSNSTSSGSYLGIYVNGTATKLTVCSYVDGKVNSTITYTGSFAGTALHVKVDYTAETTSLFIASVATSRSETTLINTSVNNTDTSYLSTILGSSSVLQFSKGNIGDGLYYDGYLDTVKIYASKSGEESDTPEETDSGHPICARPGEVSVNHQLFYSIDGSGDNITGVVGVEYTLYQKQSDGTYKALYSIPTTSSYEIDLGSLAEGDYKLKQTHVPSGYMLNPEEKTFTVVKDVYTNIGIFYVYKEGDSVSGADKTAQVVDYVNRTYQVDLSALSYAYKYNFEVRDYSLVVDQSNSMLFPAELTDTGKTVKLTAPTSTNGKVDSNETNMENAGLDKDKVYYIIADESKTSTVYALWYDDDSENNGANPGWCYQDAAYYAKAQFNELGIFSNLASETSATYGDYTIIYAKPNYTYSKWTDTTYGSAKQATGGAGIKYLSSTLSGDATTSGKTYKIYTGSQYDRLHDLQEAVSLFAQQLASLTPESNLRIETFDKDVESCVTETLNPAGVKSIIGTVNTMATAGGTRQDRALRHLVGDNDSGHNNTGHTTNHLSNTTHEQIVILITDGAPVTASGDSTASIDTVKSAATQVKNAGATLMTIGLSTKNVDAGSSMLKEIATSTTLTDSGAWFFDAENAGDLTKILIENILFKQGTKEKISETGDIKDVISDSFYPINPKDNTPLSNNTTIDLNGNVLEDVTGRTDYGTVYYDETNKQWYVIWNDQTLDTPSDSSGGSSSSTTATTATKTSTTTTYTWTDGTVLDPEKTYYIDNNYNLITGYNTLPTSNVSSGENIAAVSYDSTTDTWTATWYRWSTNKSKYTTNNVDDPGDTDMSSTNRVTKTITTETEASETDTSVTDTSGSWHGRIYLKAKEDFIGGNTIDTNDSASVTVEGDVVDTTGADDGKGTVTGTSSATIDLDTPTVNVRLLPFEGYESEETVFLGDSVTDIKKKIQTLFAKTVFEKIVSGSGDILNYKTGATTDNGCYDSTFSIPYAIQEHSSDAWSLTDDQWTALMNGESITVDYTYDDDSSHGAVGYFTFALTKTAVTGEISSYDDHKTSETGKDVEKYTLSVTYTAYGIGETDSEDNERNTNVHNGTNGPGTEVGKGADIPNGIGTETVDEIHHVHVLDGEIYLTKYITESMKSSADQTFTFKLSVLDSDGNWTTYDDNIQVTVKAGKTAGTIKISHLPRNSYKVEETSTPTGYSLKEVKVVDPTSCTYTSDTSSLTFNIGTNEASTGTDKDVIIWLTGDAAPTYMDSYVEDGTKRYVYSYPYTKVTLEQATGGTSSGSHKETITTETECESGTIISTDTSGDKYQILTDSMEDIEANHTSYGTLTKSADGTWKVAWTTWTSKEEETSTCDWPDGTLISESYEKLDKTEETLKNSHTNYGVLSQGSDGKWYVVWHTWTTTQVCTWSDGTIIDENYNILTETESELKNSHTTYGVLSKGSNNNWTVVWHTFEEVTTTGSGSDTYTAYTVTCYSKVATDWSKYTTGDYYYYTDSEYKKITGITYNDSYGCYYITLTFSDNSTLGVNATDPGVDWSDTLGNTRTYTFYTKSSSSGTTTKWEESTSSSKTVASDKIPYETVYSDENVGDSVEADTTKLPMSSVTKTVWTPTTAEAVDADSTKIPTTTTTSEVVVPNDSKVTVTEITGTVTSTSISVGYGEVYNGPKEFSADIPVKKTWEDGEAHSSDEVYVVLYNKDGIVLDDNECAYMLELNATNSWTGTFTITAPSEGYDPIANGYYVLEVSKKEGSAFDGSQKAKLVNESASSNGVAAGTQAVYYVQTVAAKGYVTFSDQIYTANYETQTDETTEKSTLVVINKPTYELPASGGIGTTPFTISGLAMITFAGGIMINKKRRKEDI